MRRRKRIAGRFWLFLLALLIIAFLIVRPYIHWGVQKEVILMATSASTITVDAVIIREEEVVSSDSIARVEFAAAEGSLVMEGDVVAYTYTTGYSEGLLRKLETTRENIQVYHKTLLANILDVQLEMYDDIVWMMAEEFKALVNGETIGDLFGTVEKLETSMVNRQNYMRQNKREDTKLTTLYEEENSRLSSIASWRSASSAARNGVVSFHLDGYELDLTAEEIQFISSDDIRAVLDGRELENTQSTRQNGIYRIVNEETWYIAVITSTEHWNPVVGQTYYVQFEGFSDLACGANVVRVQKEGQNVLAIFQVNDPIGSFIYQRTGRASFSINLTGLSVSANALVEQNGQTGVWLYDVPEGTFVAVDVLSSDGKTAIIQPVVEGSLQMGQMVLIK